MARQFASWYSIERWQKPEPEDTAAYEEMFGHKPHRMIYKSIDKTLFSKGRYPTKITPDELAPSFMPARIFKLFGYYDSSAIKGISYSPNLWVNHLFRDDILYVSFQVEKVSKDDWETHDILLCGWDIVICLAALEAYSSISEERIRSVEREVAEKVKLYSSKHPDEIDCIEEASYWEILASYRERIASDEIFRPY